MQELCGAIDRLSADRAQRVLILRGAGAAFCAGLDLREAADPALNEASGRQVAKTLLAVRNAPLVTICAAHGSALAGGGGLMAACDIVVASDDLRIGFPEVRRGLLPALITGILRDRVRDGDLRELFLAAEPIEAGRALQIGLVQRVVPADRLLEDALALARSVLAGGPESVRQTKRLLNELADEAPGEMMDHLLQAHHAARKTDEAREGLAAFLEKRQPNWKVE
jgi:methylglutaconyl-CoA hydratase